MFRIFCLGILVFVVFVSGCGGVKLVRQSTLLDLKNQAEAAHSETQAAKSEAEAAVKEKELARQEAEAAHSETQAAKSEAEAARKDLRAVCRANLLLRAELKGKNVFLENGYVVDLSGTDNSALKFRLNDSFPELDNAVSWSKHTWPVVIKIDGETIEKGVIEYVGSIPVSDRKAYWLYVVKKREEKPNLEELKHQLNNRLVKLIY